MSARIIIPSGRLAGLTLGIRLRQRGVPVTVWAVGRYPGHHIYNESISGRGWAWLAWLGLLAGLINAAAAPQ